MPGEFSFTAGNEDVVFRVSCPNHARRVAEIVQNLGLSSLPGEPKKRARFTALGCELEFAFDGAAVPGSDIRHEAVFFENTDYPVFVCGRGKKVSELSLALNDRKGRGETCAVTSEGSVLYGSLNFRNQVGLTDFTVSYKVAGEERSFKFMTEVLSYKLDYRSDLKTVIADIENEYAMLSASFLKDTYMSMRRRAGSNTSLIWWQIFKACHAEIVAAARRILERPRRRLTSVPTFERAERLQTLTQEHEAEYGLHRENPAHLYRTSELVSNHDTTENRFLKYALNSMLRRFLMVKEHIMTAMHLEDSEQIDVSLHGMERALKQLCNHSFFRGIGAFKGFTQESLVMKRASAYRTIFEKWLELRQGYELEEGMRKLEVKDVSELYEIWCFIKVKNIVSETLQELGSGAEPRAHGREVSRDFIPQLVYGGSVSFIDEGGVELASVSYNSEVLKAGRSGIGGTNTMTTVQRPDIVLRLSKAGDSMKYTYLFDAKYRIDDAKIGGMDVPPEDAIDQMHRYRDAIYYTGEGRDNLKKEIIAGYVLFPGKVQMDSFDAYYYEQANRAVGIGAFPLRPGEEVRAEDGSLVLDPNSSEHALRRQIKKWLTAGDSRAELLSGSIPQKGLAYTEASNLRGEYFLSSVDVHVNEDPQAIFEGRAGEFYTGYAAVLSGVDFQKIKYFLPLDGHEVGGVYEVKGVSAKDLTEVLERSKEGTPKGSSGYGGFDQPIRVRLELGSYKPFEAPFTYGVDALAAKGAVLGKKAVMKRLEEARAGQGQAAGAR